MKPKYGNYNGSKTEFERELNEKGFPAGELKPGVRNSRYGNHLRIHHPKRFDELYLAWLIKREQNKK